MNEQLAAALFWLILLTPLGVFARQVREVRRGSQRRLRATMLFFGYSMIPVLAYVAGYLLLVAAEEITARPLIGEEFARILVPLSVICVAEVLLLTLIFGITARLMRIPGSNQTRNVE